MYQLIIFDLDDTICAIGKGVTPENIERLRRLEEKGARIAICSGKPVDYLCGFLRQLGLKRPVLSGENGAVIQVGIDLPPKEFYIQTYSEEAKKGIRFLREQISARLPQIWYQPNLVGLTPFPSSDLEFDLIREVIDQNRENLRDLIVYRHVDSFDITPVGVDKKTGVALMGKVLGIDCKDMIAVGNGVNDYPMFEAAGLSVGVSVPDPKKADVNFTVIEEALEYLEGLF